MGPGRLPLVTVGKGMAFWAPEVQVPHSDFLGATLSLGEQLFRQTINQEPRTVCRGTRNKPNVALKACWVFSRNLHWRLWSNGSPAAGRAFWDHQSFAAVGGFSRFRKAR